MDQHGATPRAWVRPAVLAALLCFVAGASFWHPVTYANEWQRFTLLSAVVDHGTLSIDVFEPDPRDDVSVYQGRYYSNKAFGAPLLAAPAYGLARLATGLEPLHPVTRYVARLAASTLPFALAAGLLVALAVRMGRQGEPGRSLRGGARAALAFGLGSIALVHATMFSGHGTAGSLAFAAFYLLYELRRGGLRHWAVPLGAGLLAGLAALCDYTAMYLALVLAAYAVFPLRGGLPARHTILFLLGGGICVGLLGAYNQACFGAPWSMSYAHQSNPDWSAGAAQGLLGIGGFDLGMLAAILVSPSRGLFFVMPVFLLALPGLARMWRAGRRSEAGVIAAAAGGYALLMGAYYFGHGGWAYGPRYLTPVLPFLALALAFAPTRAGFGLLLAVSLIQVLPAVVVVPTVPHQIANPLAEAILPLAAYGYAAFNLGNLLGLPDPWSLLPVAGLLAGLGWWMWTAAGRATGPPGLAAARLKAGALVAAVAVAVALATVSTPQAKLVHCTRAHLMYNAAKRGLFKGEPRAILVERRRCQEEE